MCEVFILISRLISYWITGYTALHRAASWGHPDCLKVMVLNGADLQIYNTHGERAREIAARYHKDSCVEYLDRAGIYNFFFFFHYQHCQICLSHLQHFFMNWPEPAVNWNIFVVVHLNFLVEAQQALLSVISSMKDTITDPEKHLGRFTREDKVCLLSWWFCLSQKQYVDGTFRMKGSFLMKL